MNLTTAIAGIFGLLLTIAGALGAHQIPPSSAELKASWDSAMLFGFVHTLAALVSTRIALSGSLARYAGWAFLFGVVAFSFAVLISTASKAQTGTGGDESFAASIGAIAPLGGGAFMVGWILLAAASLRARS